MSVQEEIYIKLYLYWIAPSDSSISSDQWRSKLDNWGGGGAHIHIVEFTDHENNRFQTKLIVQNMNI